MSAPPRSPPTPCTAHEVQAWGRELGLDSLGVAAAEPLVRARAAIVDRIDRHLTNEMAFTFRNPDRSSNPQLALRDGRSVIVAARSYLVADQPRPPGPVARVARYAWSDHYAELRSALWIIARRLRELGWRATVYADDNAVVDREVAWLAGIGWYGKNANLLLPGKGSWFVLGCVITDADLEPAPAPVRDGCGGCRRCVDACPTAAIIAPGVIDAHRCLAWLVQKPGVFPREHRVALGDRLYGCDDCQEVCPPNVRFAQPRDGDTESEDAWVSVLAVLDASDEDLLGRFGRWYLHRRDPRWLRRNALLVLGNTGDGDQEAVVEALSRYLADPDPMLRVPAVWAASRLGLHDLLPEHDSDPDVASELHAVRGTR